MSLTLRALYSQNFDYTGNYQTFTAPSSGYYRIEAWGAGKFNADGTVLDKTYSGGAYVAGDVYIAKNTALYVYVGQGAKRYSKFYDVETEEVMWNGGGKSYIGKYCTNYIDNPDPKHDYCIHLSGSGATDIRVVSGAWNNAASLRSRIMVAAGASQIGIANTEYAGGLSAPDILGQSASGNDPMCPILVHGATQTAGGYHEFQGLESDVTGSFGVGGDGELTDLGYGSDGGGGGWYGGSGGPWKSWNADGRHNCAGSSAGSSYISGHTGAVAVASTSSSSPKTGCTTGTSNNSCSISPYGYTFSNTLMIAGNGHKWTTTEQGTQQMPNPSGGYYGENKGNNGHGHARITYLGASI